MYHDIIQVSGSSKNCSLLCHSICFLPWRHHLRHRWRSPLLDRLHDVIWLRCPLRGTLCVWRWRSTLLKFIDIVEPCVTFFASTQPIEPSSLTDQNPEADKNKQGKDGHGYEQEPSGFLCACQYLLCC